MLARPLELLSVGTTGYVLVPADRRGATGGRPWIKLDLSQFQAQGFGSGLQNGESLRMAIPIGKKDSSPQLRNSFRHGHRFCRSRGFVEERGIGDVQRGEIRDHGLEIEQRLESTLTYFRLIWRVGGVPSRILQNVALNDGRQDRVIVSLPDQRR